MASKDREFCKFCRCGREENRVDDQATPGGGCGIGAELAATRDATVNAPPIGHGKFGDWLASWFPLSESTARKWMKIAENYGGNLAVTANLGTEALDALCSTSTPEPVRTEIERRAVDGGDTSVAEIATSRPLTVKPR